ncbi:glycosyltransferase [Bacteroides sp. 51]|uniref:glycosyltransferase family 2 protein n=1 Tax=Bacteroides sp. 51 TaxID=2302938 RepID=UPI0013D48FC5|nr:glycosyltransferase [Bacteroides sp. 51]NDV84916.1 glycosyltransferase [Bacteroides sp. 51]
MKPLISIIIPVYNVEKYLADCIVSIQNQTYEKLEIILINDGSTDKSGTICDQYKLKDDRIKVIHKENGGLSDARNTGLVVCTGEYISFVDSDDYVSNEYVECLYTLLVRFSVDISTCLLMDVMDGIPLQQKKKTKLVEGKCTSRDAVKYVLQERCIMTSACGKLFSNKVFQNTFFPKGRLFEDLSTIYKLFDKVEYIAHSNEKKYYYRKNPQSIMNSSVSSKTLDIIDAHYEILDFVKVKYPDLKPLVYNRLVRYCVSFLYRIMHMKYCDPLLAREFIYVVKKHVKSYVFSHYKLKSKILAFGIAVDYSFTKKIVCFISTLICNR